MQCGEKRGDRSTHADKLCDKDDEDVLESQTALQLGLCIEVVDVVSLGVIRQAESQRQCQEGPRLIEPSRSAVRTSESQAAATRAGQSPPSRPC